MMITAGAQPATQRRVGKVAAPEASRDDLWASDRPRFRVARELDEVLAAWRMVYEVYVGAGLIHPNSYGIHTTPQTLSSCSAVFHSSSAHGVESTLTAVVDGSLGLPMDSVYKAELDTLRRQGRRVTEYGMFAHCRQLASLRQDSECEGCSSTEYPASRVQASMIHLMRLAFYFALTRNSTDMIIGVHPRHARFYSRAFGFRQFGPVRTCPAVNHRPVVLLHGNLKQSLQLEPFPHALEYCLSNPVPVDAFEDRYRFDTREMDRSDVPLRDYLAEKYPYWGERGQTLQRVAG
jgi:hypothetical protein